MTIETSVCSSQKLIKRLTTSQNAEKKHLLRVQPHMGYLYQPLLPREHHRREMERIQEPEDRDECYKILFLRHNIAIVPKTHRSYDYLPKIK